MSDKEKYFSLNNEIVFDNNCNWCYRLRKEHDSIRVDGINKMSRDHNTPQTGYKIDIKTGDINELLVYFSQGCIKEVKVIRCISRVTDLFEISEAEAFEIAKSKEVTLDKLIDIYEDLINKEVRKMLE